MAGAVYAPRVAEELASLVGAKDEHDLLGGPEGLVKHRLVVRLRCPEPGLQRRVEVDLRKTFKDKVADREVASEDWDEG
jgi:hypothetical protein